MQRIKISYLISLFFIYSFSSCINFKEVNAFSAQSRETLNSDRIISYGYASYCHDSCFVYAKKINEIRNVECTCDNGVRLDTAIRHEYDVFTAFFAELTLLTSSTTRYTFAPIASHVQNVNFGALSLSGSEAKAFSGLAEGVSRLLTAGKKEKALKEVLQNHHDDFVHALAALRIHLENLLGKIRTLKLRYETRSDELVAHSSEEAIKWLITSEYQRKIKEFQKVEQQVEELILHLNLIGAGETEIFDHLNNIKNQSFKDRLVILAGDLS